VVKTWGEASVNLYKNSLILRLAMTEYPFIHDKAFTDAKTNFIYREEVIKILPYLLDEKGIINIGSDITESFYSFAKKTKKNVKPASVKSVKNFPLNSSVKIQKLKHILKKKQIKVTDRKNMNKLMNEKKEVYLTSGPSVTQIEREIVDDMMRFGWDNSQYIKKFEYDFAKYHKRKYCILTPSIGIAFQLGIASADLKKNSRIIVPDFSSSNFLNQIIQLKFKPILTKLNTEKLSIDIKYLKKLLNNNVKGIFCSSFFGNIPDYNELKKILKDKKVFLFEDASDALGKKFKNNYAGKFGDISFHDFAKDKVITCGEGGAILTDNKLVYSKIIKLINNKEISFNSKHPELNLKSYFKPSNLQAAMLCGQFKRINNLKNKNYMIYKEYQKHLKNLGISIMGYRLMLMSFDKKYKFKIEHLIKFLKKRKIYCKRLQKPFSKLKYFKNKFNNSDNIYESSIILPSHYNLNSADIEYICNNIKFFIKKYLN
jgi:perosamine synthetase